MIAIKVNSYDQVQPDLRISARCPKCRQHGTLDSIGVNDVRIIESGAVAYHLGQRRCPKTACRNHVFFVAIKGDVNSAILYPPERFDFDPSAIPSVIQKAFEEAISCHAISAYTAAAMMIRKTLELLCHDRGAVGANLKDRIHDLGKKIIIPNELLQAIDDLRLLGNDAAHLEAKTYDDIGKEEADVAFELAKEILKATYQYSSLLGRLKALKK